MSAADDKLVAKVFIQDLHQHESWSAFCRHLLNQYPELSQYNGEDESIEVFKRQSYQREGMDKIFNILGVYKDE